MSNKIDNTFSKAATELAKLEKAFAENSKLETAVMESNGDVSVIAEVRSHIAQAIKLLTPQTITEGVLDSDDDDGFMARSQLYFLAKDAISLHGMIDDRDDLEPWVHSKIVSAAEGIDAVRRYTEYNAMKPEAPEVGPEIEPEVSDLPVSVHESDDDPIEVVFRKFEDGDVIALFPEEEQGRGMITSYMEIGQHGDASKALITDLEPASEEEYASLAAELGRIGYNIVISDTVGEDLEQTSRNRGNGDLTPSQIQKLDKKAKKRQTTEADVVEGMDFDEKKKDNMKVVAKDLFKSALAQARKKSGVK